MREWDCQQIEELLCDYIDGALDEADRLALEAHTANCQACAEYVADVAGSVQFLARVADVEAPKELITRILYHTPKPVPLIEKLSPRSWVRKVLGPLLLPRFAMGMAMTILSFSMIGKFVSPTKQLRASDLDPIKVVQNIDQALHRAWDNTIKYYDNLRLVYEIQTAIDEFKTPAQNDSEKKSPSQAGGAK